LIISMFGFPALNQDRRFLKICRMESLRIFVDE
jgi:hypothetical protein